jgi:hypothetical protein
MVSLLSLRLFVSRRHPEAKLKDPRIGATSNAEGPSPAAQDDGKKQN